MTLLQFHKEAKLIKPEESYVEVNCKVNFSGRPVYFVYINGYSYTEDCDSPAKALDLMRKKVLGIEPVCIDMQITENGTPFDEVATQMPPKPDHSYYETVAPTLERQYSHSTKENDLLVIPEELNAELEKEYFEQQEFDSQIESSGDISGGEPIDERNLSQEQLDIDSSSIEYQIGDTPLAEQLDGE